MCWVIDLHWFIEPTASGRGKGQSLLVWIGTARSSPFGESIFFFTAEYTLLVILLWDQDLHGFQDGCWILKLRCDVRAHSGSNVFWRLNIFLVKYCCEIQNLSADLITGCWTYTGNAQTWVSWRALAFDRGCLTALWANLFLTTARSSFGSQASRASVTCTLLRRMMARVFARFFEPRQ